MAHSFPNPMYILVQHGEHTRTAAVRSAFQAKYCIVVLDLWWRNTLKPESTFSRHPRKELLNRMILKDLAFLALLAFLAGQPIILLEVDEAGIARMIAKIIVVITTTGVRIHVRILTGENFFRCFRCLDWILLVSAKSRITCPRHLHSRMSNCRREESCWKRLGLALYLGAKVGKEIRISNPPLSLLNLVSQKSIDLEMS